MKSTKKKSRKIDSDEKGVYVGESSRSLYERTKEHWNDAVKDAPDSHMRKHWVECHPDMKEIPKFRFKIVKSFKDSLSRQVAESVRIDLRGNVINSKTVYSRNRLPRLEVEKPEWERAEEERRKKISDWERKETWEREKREREDKEQDEQITETEEMMTEAWRAEMVRKNKSREQESSEEGEENPKKKQRRGHYDGDKSWGQVEMSRKEQEKRGWLLEERRSVPRLKKSRQSKLIPWTGSS